MQMQLLQNRYTKALLLVGGGLSLVVVLSAIYNTFFVHNISISEPLGYYLKLSVGEIHKGNRYQVCINKKPYIEIMQSLGLPKTKSQCPYESPYLIKEVAGIPNDIVTVNESGVFINNVYQNNSKPIIEHKKIKLMPLINYTHKLESDEFFLLGRTRTSYDSRYFGVVKANQFHSRLILLMNNE